MIKIQIPDRKVFKDEYLKLMKPLILDALKKLKISLIHLDNPGAIVEEDIVVVKTFTKRIVDSIVTPKSLKGAFNKNVYAAKVANYTDGAKTVYAVDWKPLINLTDHLLNNVQDDLVTLIVGAPLELKDLHDGLFNKFGIADKVTRDIMYNAFSYDDHGEEVRKYIHKSKITVYCPYCNIARARHDKNPITGRIVNQLQLDHFFSQVDHPMLALSLFNLVPSDSVCNADNKAKKMFSDEFHLNPYVSGFAREMIFEPIFDAMGQHLTEIDLLIKADRASERWKQLIGDHDERDQAPDHGNINVFQLYYKYNDKDVFFQMERLIQTYLKMSKNDRAIREILVEIEDTEQDAYSNFKFWYECHSRTPFHEKEFGNVAYSKLHRDLLDYVFRTYPENFHGEIGQILQKSYLLEVGGQ